MWNHTTDKAAMSLGLLGRGSAADMRGCAPHLMKCVGQFGFNGLDVRRQTYFGQVWAGPAARRRFLCLHARLAKGTASAAGMHSSSRTPPEVLPSDRTRWAMVSHADLPC